MPPVHAVTRQRTVAYASLRSLQQSRTHIFSALVTESVKNYAVRHACAPYYHTQSPAAFPCRQNRCVFQTLFSPRPIATRPILHKSHRFRYYRQIPPWTSGPLDIPTPRKEPYHSISHPQAVNLYNQGAYYLLPVIADVSHRR